MRAIVITATIILTFSNSFLYSQESAKKIDPDGFNNSHDRIMNNLSRVDSIHKTIAINYLNSKFGRGFVNKFLIFDTIQPYSPILATFEVKGQSCKEGKNMVVIYFNR